MKLKLRRERKDWSYQRFYGGWTNGVWRKFMLTYLTQPSGKGNWEVEMWEPATGIHYYYFNTRKSAHVFIKNNSK